MREVDVNAHLTVGRRYALPDGRGTSGWRVRRWMALMMLVLVAVGVRGFRAWTEPIVNPDLIRFVKQGQGLGVDPVEAMRGEVYHPLQSAAGLGVHAIVGRFFGNDRIAWLWSLKAVGILAGAVVTLQIFWLGRRLGAPFWYSLAAAGVFTVSRRTSAYGADGLSDMLHLALFAGAILCVIRPRPLFFVGGLLAGLAYLARPEGLAAVVIVMIMLVLQVFTRRAFNYRIKPVLRGRFALLLGTAIPVIFYTVVMGTVSAKEAKLVSQSFDPHGPQGPIALAAIPLKMSKEVWETFGFAPYLITLVTFVISIFVVRRVWIRGRLRALVAAWLFFWVVVMAVVARRLGYLDGRHTLILVFLLYGLFALALFAIHQILRHLTGSRTMARIAVGAFIGAALLPGLVLLRNPARADKNFLLQGVRWVQDNTPGDTLVADHEQLIGYYADRPYRQWVGTPANPALESLPVQDHLLLAYHYYHDQGDVAVSSIGPFESVATFVSPNRKETLTLYALPK